MTANPSPAPPETCSSESDSTHALLLDCRWFLKGVEKLFAVLPPRMKAGHLASVATGLVARIDNVTFPPDPLAIEPGADEPRGDCDDGE